MEKLFTSAKIETIENEKLFVASDDVFDRQGDVIVQDGWELSNFKKNPVIEWAHNPYEPAIGTAAVGFKTINGKKKLVFSPTFHRKSEMSRLISDLVEEGIIKASSVGFKPIEVEENKYLKNELLEISFVNVPANQNALALSGANLAMTKGYAPELIKSVFPDVDLKDKAVIPYKKYPHAPEDTDWDGPAEVKAASVEDLKKMCAWFDAENADSKGAYKLPHHTVDGYKTVLAGCQAAMGAMMGARGGVDIPEADRKAVYDHLARHYLEFEKTPPEMRTGKYIQMNCQNCGELFDDYLGNNRKFCSQKCAKESLSIFLKSNRLGERNPNFRDYDVYCKVCGEPIERAKRSKSIYCSVECMGIDRDKEKNPNWKGGNRTDFREQVFERDDFTCQKCGKRGGNLNAHHMLSFQDNPDTRFMIENGITLCTVCHYTFHNEFGFVRNDSEQLRRFFETETKERRVAIEDSVNKLNDTVSLFIAELQEENKVKKEIAEKNTDSFKNEIKKRFEDINMNVQGLQEGIAPTDKGLEQRLLDIESNIEQIASGIRAIASQSSSEKGAPGREPNRAPESKSDQQRRLALKVMNKALEVMNKTSNK